jgi:hypothetical protein
VPVFHVVFAFLQAQKVTMVAALPPSVSKFEEKNLISLDNANNTTQVLSQSCSHPILTYLM